MKNAKLNKLILDLENLCGDAVRLAIDYSGGQSENAEAMGLRLEEIVGDIDKILKR